MSAVLVCFVSGHKTLDDDDDDMKINQSVNHSVVNINLKSNGQDTNYASHY